MKAYLDLFLHQNTLQWGRFQPLYWIEAAYLGSLYFLLGDGPFLKVAAFLICTLLMGYLWSLSYIDWRVKRRYIAKLKELGLTVDPDIRPWWYWRKLPVFDILSISLLYVGLVLVNAAAPFMLFWYHSPASHGQDGRGAVKEMVAPAEASSPAGRSVQAAPRAGPQRPVSPAQATAGAPKASAER